MSVQGPAQSARRTELLEAAYRYALEHGLSDLSLRPLAAAIGSSPRVLLFLFGSKNGLVRALLTRARADELALIRALREPGGQDVGGRLADVTAQVWSWLAAQDHRALLTLWMEGYSRSLIDPGGPWAGFASATVEDWLAVLADAQPSAQRHTSSALAERTLVLAVLRGALLDLLATGDVERTTAAVQVQLRGLGPAIIRSRTR